MKKVMTDYDRWLEQEIEYRVAEWMKLKSASDIALITKLMKNLDFLARVKDAIENVYEGLDDEIYDTVDDVLYHQIRQEQCSKCN